MKLSSVTITSRTAGAVRGRSQGLVVLAQTRPEISGQLPPAVTVGRRVVRCSRSAPRRSGYCQPPSSDRRRSSTNSRSPATTASVGRKPAVTGNSQHPRRRRRARTGCWRPSGRQCALRIASRPAPSGSLASVSRPSLSAGAGRERGRAAAIAACRGGPDGRREGDTPGRRSRRRPARSPPGAEHQRLGVQRPARSGPSGARSRQHRHREWRPPRGVDRPAQLEQPAAVAQEQSLAPSAHGRPEMPPKSRSPRAQLERTQKLQLAQPCGGISPRPGQRHGRDPATRRQPARRAQPRARAAPEHDRQRPGCGSRYPVNKQTARPDRGGPVTCRFAQHGSVSCAGCRTAAAAS